MVQPGDTFGLNWETAERCHLTTVADGEDTVTVRQVLDTGFALCIRSNGVGFLVPVAAIEGLVSPVVDSDA